MSSIPWDIRVPKSSSNNCELVQECSLDETVSVSAPLWTTHLVFEPAVCLVSLRAGCSETPLYYSHAYILNTEPRSIHAWTKFHSYSVWRKVPEPGAILWSERRAKKKKSAWLEEK